MGVYGLPPATSLGDWYWGCGPRAALYAEGGRVASGELGPGIPGYEGLLPSIGED